jgi:hypothetical protein
MIIVCKTGAMEDESDYQVHLTKTVIQVIIKTSEGFRFAKGPIIHTTNTPSSIHLKMQILS